MGDLIIKSKTSKKRKNSIIILTIIVILLLICSIFVWKTYQYSLSAVDKTVNQEVIFQIEKGSNAILIAENLKKQGLIRNSKTFRLYMRLTGTDNKIKAGNYLLSSSMDVSEIIKILTSGKTVVQTVTIPEGYNLKQITKLLSDKGIVNEAKFKQALQKSYDYPFLQPLQAGSGYLEGYLFPDTYSISYGLTEEEIVNMLLKRFYEVVYLPFNDHLIKKGLSWHEVITLASIVEREGKAKEELPVIAGVFYNRINQGWKLESCATVQFLLPQPKEVLTLKDLEINSPYNTYLNPGLPPGPIAAPGLAAIKAAISPRETDYLFFVANNDGTHVFSETFSEHLSAKNKVIK